MTIVEQKLGSVFLRRNRKIVSVLQNFGVGDVNFDPTGRTCVFAYFTRYGERRFLTERLQGFPNFFRNSILRHNALNDSGAVAQLRKQKLAARAHVVEPALNGDFFTDVAG